MFSVSAFQRTAVLLFSVLFMAAVWSLGRVPGASLQMIVFTCLSSALLVEIRPFGHRLMSAAVLACYSSVVQFLLSVSGHLPFLQIILSILLAFFTFYTLPDYRAGCVVMLTGYLALSAPYGFLPAIDRCADIFVGMIFAAVIAAVGNTTSCSSDVCPAWIRYSPYQALVLAAELGIGAIISNALRLQLGAWVMMTILFINMSKPPDSSAVKLAYQRIFAVPAGIIICGFFLSAFCRIDSRLVWLLPFIGASGFFVLYNYGNFFLFSIIFMVTLTFLADWMAGPYNQLHLWDIFFSRSIATLIGAFLEFFLCRCQSDRTGEAV